MKPNGLPDRVLRLLAFSSCLLSVLLTVSQMRFAAYLACRSWNANSVILYEILQSECDTL